MISAPYSNLDNTVVSSISGNRKHFTMRPLLRSYLSYEYETKEGDNFFGLATSIFGADKFWWILSDLNPTIDAFVDFDSNQRLNLPETLVDYSSQRIML